MVCLQVRELQTGENDVMEIAGVEDDDDDDDDGAAGESFDPITEETDEEYVPAAELSSLSASVPSARKRKAQMKTDKSGNNEDAEGEAKKDPVQCPICDKSFKSKYYLKVHNRYNMNDHRLVLNV